MQTITDLVKVLEEAQALDQAGLTRLLTAPEAIPLYHAADRVRKRYVGDEVHLRGLIEFSNYCRRGCLYCGLRAGNTQLRRYRMTPAEILARARYAVGQGLKTVVLQSGEDPHYTVEELCDIVRTLKKMDVAVTLSIGERSKDTYAALKEAGADRFLLRIETSNEQLYARMHPGMSYQNRVNCLYTLKELGYETGTGSLVGLPGQTPAMLAADLVFFKALDADMIGIGPFIPSPGTPLDHAAGGEVETVLKMMALARLLMPEINMPATTALSVKDRDGYRKGLNCGANVIMPNVGRSEYKKLYAVYPGKGEGFARSDEQMVKIQTVLQKLGRKVGQGYGFRVGR